MRKTFVLSFTAAAVLLIAGCHDTLTPPTAGSVRGPAAALVSTLVAPVERSTPLAQDVSWSFPAGPQGGSTNNAATGLTFSVPAGALAEDVTITITALAGKAVAYRFEPHGLVFANPAQFTQDLSATTLNLLSGLGLQGAYFATDSLAFDASGLLAVSEVIGALTNPLNRTASFPVRHFSGYILASGRSEPDSTESAQ